MGPIDHILKAILADANVHEALKASIEARLKQPTGGHSSEDPRVTDNDRDEITVTLNGKELRGWSYSSEPERRVKMLAAREYVEGYCDGRDAQ